jgi:hypothetical protein
MINRECPRAIRNAWARALTAEAVRPRSSAMLDSEALEMTSSRSRSSSSEVQALQLFIFLVAISSGHARFRALDAAGLSFFASALAARIPLIGRSISFVPLRPCVASCPLRVQTQGRLRCCVSGQPSGRLRSRPLAAPSQQWACRYASHAIQAAAFARREPEPRGNAAAAG